MATAKIEMKEVQTITLEKRVVLELSLEEAATLSLILGNTGGDPEESARKYSYKIYQSLVDVLGSTLSYRECAFDKTAPNYLSKVSLQQVERFAKDNS